jgi:hypothetical protein
MNWECVVSHTERIWTDNFSKHDAYENIVTELEEVTGDLTKLYSE